MSEPINLEGWALRTIRDGVIDEWEFAESLPRISQLAMTYGFEPLGEVLVDLTTAGIPFTRALALLEPQH